MNEIKLLKNHSIAHWKINGVDLLYPLHNKGTESRGGSPLCAPMFSVQQRPVAGCILPLHGILMYKDNARIDFNEEKNTWTATTEHKADSQFAWNFTATTTIKTDGHQLLHNVVIERDHDCSNEDEMPLSLGFHPYFNTFGEDFSYTINDIETGKDDVPKNIIDSDFAHLNDEAVVLRTAAGTITINPSGYDEYCLWTDDIDKYFCIEPIYQYREFGLPNTGLMAGQKKEVSCKLHFQPT